MHGTGQRAKMRSCKDKGEMIIYIIIIKASMNDEGTADFKTEFISERKQAPHIIQSEGEWGYQTA